MKLRRSVRWSHGHAFAYNAFYTLTTGVFLSDYLLRLGWRDYDFGVLYFLMYLAGLVLLPFSFAIDRIADKRAFYIRSNLVSFALLALFVAAPYLPGVSAAGINALSLWAMGLSVIAGGVGQVVLFPWLYRAVGSGGWVRFFLHRQIVAFSTPIAITLGFGFLLRSDRLGTLSLLFVAALAFGLLSMLFMGGVPDLSDKGEPELSDEGAPDPSSAGEPAARAAAGHARSILRGMRSNRAFLLLLGHMMLVSVGIGLLTPVVFPYLSLEADLPASRISLYQTAMMVMSALAVVAVSRWCERRGSPSALIALSGLLWLVPCSLLLMPASVPVFSLLLFALGVNNTYGFAFTGIFIAFTNVLLPHTPEQGRVVYFAMIELVRTVALATSAYAGGALAQSSGGFDAAGREADGYTLVFAISAVAMLAAGLLALRMRIVLSISNKSGSVYK